MIAPNTRILWLPGAEDRHWDFEGGSFGGRGNAAGVRIDPETALRSTVVLACVRVLSSSVAGLPLHLYRRLPNGGKELARENPLYRVLHDTPNSWQTSYEWREQMMLHLLTHGQAFVEIGGAGPQTQLVVLHPSRMKVERVENGRLRYTYREASGQSTVYAQDAIMHLRWMSDDGVNGLVPVELAKDAIGLARALEIHGASFFGNGARPGVVLTTDQMLSPEAAENTRNQWERVHRGPDRAHRTAVLQGGLKIAELGGTNVEAQFLEARRFAVEEVCRVYGVPPHLVGDLSRSSYSNIEQQSLDYVQNGLMPWLRRIESAISRDLITDGDLFAEFDTRGALRADAAGRASYFNTMATLGVLSVNDIRSAENMNPVEGGDERFVQLNMTTLTKAAAQPEPVVDAASEEPAPEPAVPADAPTVLGVLDQYRQGAINAQAAKALLQAAFPQTPEVMIDTILAGVVVPEPEPEPVAPEPVPEPEAPAPEPLAASLPASRDCGTGAGGFKPGNKCAGDEGGVSDSSGGGSGGGGDSGGSVSPEKARAAAREMGVDPTDPKQVAAAVRMQGVISSNDPLRSTMTRIMVDIPEDHTPGLARVSSTTQGVDLVTEISVPGGVAERTVYGFYSPSKREIVLSGGDNMKVLGGGTLHHEVGHHVHEFRLNGDGDKEWRSISGNGENARISAYATTSRGEHFCEAYSAFARGGSHRARLKSLEPKVYAFMQKVFRKNSKLLNPGGGLGSYDPTRWGN